MGFKANNQLLACMEEYKNTTYGCQVAVPNTEPTQWTNGTIDYFLSQASQGTGLTFIAFAEAIKEMPVPWLWAILFFIMLLTLGMGTMMGTFITVRQTIVELEFIPIRSELIGGALCAFSFVIGLVFCQR